MSNKQTAGDLSTNIQGQNITINHITNSYSPNSLEIIEEVGKKLLESTFGELPDETKSQIESNRISYITLLGTKLKSFLWDVEDLQRIIYSPDFQYIGKVASISAMRSSNSNVHEILSSLVIERIKSNDDDSKITHNLAIECISKLSQDQLKFILFLFLIRHPKIDEKDNSLIQSWEDYKNFLENDIRPLLDTSIDTHDYDHMQHIGVIKSNTRKDRAFYKDYDFLYKLPVTEQEVDDLNLGRNLKDKIFIYNDNQKIYSLRRTFLEEYKFFNPHLGNYIAYIRSILPTITNQASKEKLNTIFTKQIKQFDTLEHKIAEEVDCGNNLLDLWLEKYANFFVLTSSGYTIGRSLVLSMDSLTWNS